jgi:hypothetical protein
MPPTKPPSPTPQLLTSWRRRAQRGVQHGHGQYETSSSA